MVFKKLLGRSVRIPRREREREDATAVFYIGEEDNRPLKAERETPTIGRGTVEVRRIWVT